MNHGLLIVIYDLIVIKEKDWLIYCDSLVKESISQFSWNQNHHSTSRKHAESDHAVKSWDGRGGSSRPRPSKCLGLLSTCNGSLDSKLLKLPFPSPHSTTLLSSSSFRRIITSFSFFRLFDIFPSTLQLWARSQSRGKLRSHGAPFPQFSWLFSKSQALAVFPKSL